MENVRANITFIFAEENANFREELNLEVLFS